MGLIPTKSIVVLLLLGSFPITAHSADWDDLADQLEEEGPFAGCVTDYFVDKLLFRAGKEIAAQSLASTPEEQQKIRNSVDLVKSGTKLATNLGSLLSGEPILMCQGAIGCLVAARQLYYKTYGGTELNLTKSVTADHSARDAELLWSDYVDAATLKQSDQAALRKLSENTKTVFARRPHLLSLRERLADPEARPLARAICEPFVNVLLAAWNKSKTRRSKAPVDRNLLRAAWAYPESRPQIIEQMLKVLNRHPLTYYGRQVPASVSNDPRFDFYASIGKNFGQVSESFKQQVKNFSEYWNSLAPAEKRLALTQLMPVILE